MSIKSRPYENFLVDFCTFSLLKALKTNLFYTKKTPDGQTLRSAEVQESAREFSHSLYLKVSSTFVF